jgi:hypothetical protein
MIRLLLVVGTAAASLYTPTPAGDVLSHCVHHVPHNARVVEQADKSTLVTAPNGTSWTIPRCENVVGGVKHPVLRRRPAARNASGVLGGLPADYNGWLQYTAYNDPKGFDSFVGEMSVPDAPRKRPQILYLFPGLQNIDWIPKVDPEPTRANPFDIIQPVLQYPGDGLFSTNWAVKSWYVTVNAGALQSEAIDVEAGDAIVCNMTRTGPTSWFVGSKVKSSGQQTNQNAQNDRLKLQPWAYNTLECYGCNGCDTYPQAPVEFSKLKLGRGGQDVTSEVQWQANPKPQSAQQCKEATQIHGADDVTISFQ